MRSGALAGWGVGGTHYQETGCRRKIVEFRVCVGGLDAGEVQHRRMATVVSAASIGWGELLCGGGHGLLIDTAVVD